MADIGIATLALTQSYAQFQAYMPKLQDIRKTDPIENPEFAADVRIGEIAALIGSLGVGVIASSLTGDPLPAYVSLATSLMLIALYEYVLRAHHPMERTA
jgi:hypothetical protein